MLWTEKTDMGPPGRAGAAMAFDAQRHRTIMFGGESQGTRLNDTWGWDGEQWTQLDNSGPQPRSRCGMVFDGGTRHVLLFGGDGDGGPLGDTWRWDGASWTQLAETVPATRSGHAMVYDSERNRTVVFGGRAGDEAQADTWEWDGTAWTQVQDVGPQARMDHAMAFDPVRARCVLFGGNTQGDVALRDTWEWDGSAWTQESDFGPAQRFGAAMAFKGDEIALFGGIASSAPTAAPFGDTWGWDGSLWTQRQDIGPSARRLHAMAFDSDRRHLVLFGGDAGGGAATSLAQGTWEHSQDTGGGPGGGGEPIGLTELNLSPAELRIGQFATVGVFLTAPAPASGVVVKVQFAGPSLSDLRLGIVPLDQLTDDQRTFVVQEGAAEFDFPLNWFQQTVPTSSGELLVTITVTVGADAATAELVAE